MPTYYIGLDIICQKTILQAIVDRWVHCRQICFGANILFISKRRSKIEPENNEVGVAGV